MALVVTIISIISYAKKRIYSGRVREEEYLSSLNIIENKLIRNKHLFNRFTQYGITDFSDLELVDLLISLNPSVEHSELRADELINKYHSLRGVIDALVGKSSSIEGIKIKHTFIMRLFKEVGERYLRQEFIDLPYGGSTKVLFNYLKHSMRGLEYEQFKIICLNSQNRIISIDNISNGSVTEAAVYIREVIKLVLAKNAVSIVIVHNHLDSNIEPSLEDIYLTEKMMEACQLFNIFLLDHIIIGDNKYYSFAEHSLIKSDGITYESI